MVIVVSSEQLLFACFTNHVPWPHGIEKCPLFKVSTFQNFRGARQVLSRYIWSLKFEYCKFLVSHFFLSVFVYKCASMWFQIRSGLTHLERLDPRGDDVTDDADMSSLLRVCRQEAGLWTGFLNVLDDGQLCLITKLKVYT